MSEANGREHSPEFRRERSGAGTEVARDAAGAEDPRRRGGSQGHRPVRGAARVRQLVVAIAGRLRSWGTIHETVRRTLKYGFSCKRKVQYWVPESDAEFVAERVLERETLRTVRWSAWTSGRCSWSRRRACAATADPARRLRAGGHRVDFHVLRGPVLLAPGDGPRAQDEWAEEVASLRPLRRLRAPWCATTSTPARRERSTKRPARARELVKRAAARRSTGAG